VISPGADSEKAVRIAYLALPVFFSAISPRCAQAQKPIRAIKTVHFCLAFLASAPTPESETAAVLLLQSLDNFLVGLVLLIFAFGICRIFADVRLEEDMPAWLREVKTLRDLKLMLWEAILVIMLIFSVSYMNAHRGQLNWTFLALPDIIFLVAVSYYLMKRADK
jgi:uncharacterized membrane protein YqhA